MRHLECDVSKIKYGVIINLTNYCYVSLKSNSEKTIARLYPKVLTKIVQSIDMRSEYDYTLQDRSIAEWAIPTDLLIYNCFCTDDINDNNYNILPALKKLRECESVFKTFVKHRECPIYICEDQIPIKDREEIKEQIYKEWEEIIFIKEHND